MEIEWQIEIDSELVGCLRSLQDCVCTHIERDLECSSEGGKKEGGNLIRGR
jgi:hypothetical protein